MEFAEQPGWRRGTRGEGGLGESGWRPAEERKVQEARIHAAGGAGVQGGDSYRGCWLLRHGDRYGGMHGDAERAIGAVFASEGAFRLRAELRVVVGEPVAVHVRGLGGAGDEHKEQAGKRHQTRPQGRRVRQRGVAGLDHGAMGGVQLVIWLDALRGEMDSSGLFRVGGCRFDVIRGSGW